MADTAELETNKNLMRNYIEEFWNNDNYDLVDRVIAEDVVLHDVAESDLDVPPGREGVKALHRMFRTAFPDFSMTVEDVVAEGDKVVLRWSAQGTHTGEFGGIPPTHRWARYEAIAITRLRNGQIAEGWQVVDTMSLLQQLGVVPSGKMPAPMRMFIAARGRLRARKNRKAAAG